MTWTTRSLTRLIKTIQRLVLPNQRSLASPTGGNLIATSPRHFQRILKSCSNMLWEANFPSAAAVELQFALNVWEDPYKLISIGSFDPSWRSAFFPLRHIINRHQDTSANKGVWKRWDTWCLETLSPWNKHTRHVQRYARPPTNTCAVGCIRFILTMSTSDGSHAPPAYGSAATTQTPLITPASAPAPMAHPPTEYAATGAPPMPVIVGEYPQPMKCPYCQAEMLTRVV